LGLIVGSVKRIRRKGRVRMKEKLEGSGRERGRKD